MFSFFRFSFFYIKLPPSLNRTMHTHTHTLLEGVETRQHSIRLWCLCTVCRYCVYQIDCLEFDHRMRFISLFHLFARVCVCFFRVEIQFYLKHSAIGRWSKIARMYLLAHILVSVDKVHTIGHRIRHVLEEFQSMTESMMLNDIMCECVWMRRRVYASVQFRLCSTMQFHHEFESNWMISTP